MSVMNMPLSIQDELHSYHDLNNKENNNNTNYTSSLAPLEQAQQGQELIKELYNQIEQLTLNNARLVRANRILKLEVEEKTAELKQALKLSIEQNIRLQRANRLLQDEYQQKRNELNDMKRDGIRKMKNIGPEYEYLVQVINLLYRQLSGKSNCEETCCYTEQELIQTQQHYCRPTIKSHVQSGNIVSRLEQENYQLKDSMDILLNDRDSLFQLLQDKELELKVKDDIVKRLEDDFIKMELEVSDLQKDWYGVSSSSSSDHHSITSELHEFPSVPHKISIVQQQK